MRGYVKSGAVERVRAAGGEVYAITSEPQTLASRAQREWGLDFETVGDPHHEITQTCRERGWMELFVNREMDFLKQSSKGVADFEPTHPKGYFQPGVLALDADGRVLYRWRGVPTRKNMGGAMERPTADHVVDKVLDARDSDRPDAAFDEDPTLDSRGIPWPIFVTLLIANGWFLQARGFGQRRGGPTPKQRLLRAALRTLAFGAAWVAAFALLPALPVAAALAVWVLWIVPKVRFVNRQFQNVEA